MLCGDIKQKFKQINKKLTYTYKGHKINIILLIVLSIILSRLLMYVVFNIGVALGNKEGNFFQVLNIWDAAWYNELIAKGYDLTPKGNIKGDAANWAFFPLYPLIVRLIYNICKKDIATLGSIISTIFFMCALIVGYLYIVETRKNKKVGIIYILIMCFGVYSFYFSMLYTEALYIFLLTLALYFLHKDKYILLGITGALLSATRNMGVMIVFAVLVHYTMKYINNKNKSIAGYFIDAFKNSKLIFGTILIPSGLFLYMTYLEKLTGDPLAFAHIQVAWERTNSNPIIRMIKEILYSLLNRNKAGLYLSIWAAAGFLLAIYLIIEKRYEEAILAFIFLLIPLSSSVQSIPRYIIGSFVFMISFLDILEKLNNKWLYIGIILLSSCAELYLIFRWFGYNSGFLC